MRRREYKPKETEVINVSKEELAVVAGMIALCFGIANLVIYVGIITSSANNMDNQKDVIFHMGYEIRTSLNVLKGQTVYFFLYPSSSG